LLIDLMIALGDGLGDLAKAQTTPPINHQTTKSLNHQILSGGEAGIRTLRPRLSNLVMARDFWF